MGRYPARKIDRERAQRLLNGGASVAEVARAFSVSASSVYEHIAAGRLRRPDIEGASDGDSRGAASPGSGAGAADAA